MTVAPNVAARDAFTVILGGDPPKVALTGAEAEKALLGWIYKQDGMTTLSDCVKAHRAVVEQYGEAEAMKLLKRFNGVAITDPKDLWLGSWQGYYAAAEKLLEGEGL